MTINSRGEFGNKGGFIFGISGDDRHVVFDSDSTNLVQDDTNGVGDIFVRDVLANKTERASLGDGGVEANGVSGSGVISSGGRFVAFQSRATNLTAHDSNGDALDIFVRDRLLRTTTLVSVTKDGVQADSNSSNPAVSNDGRYVCFNSYARNLVLGDSNNTQDVFLKDMLTGEIERISVSSTETEGNSQSGASRASLSDDARFICFSSTASNLVEGDNNRVSDTFVRDRLLGTTTRVSVRTDGGEGHRGGGTGVITADGRYVAFGSASTNLVDEADINGTLGDIFMHDLWTRTTWRISESTQGEQGNDQSEQPAISANGRIVAYGSRATNLVPNDTNGYRDIFIHVNSEVGR